MVAYNFKSQFAPKVESGEKRQTIRANGKRRHARPGEALQLYTGMRTRACRKLIDPDPICTEAIPIRVSWTWSGILIWLAGDSVVDTEAFARADGFGSAVEMRDFIYETHGMPFEGTCIKWER